MRIEKNPIRYIEMKSHLHAIHPVVKLFWLVITFTTALMNQNTLVEVIFLLFIISQICMLKINFFRINGIRAILFTAVIIWMLQIFFNHDGITLFSFWKLLITDIGFKRGLYLSARFCLIVFIGFIFVFTTNLNKLVYSLMQLGISYRYGFAFITAMRLITVFTDEIEKIYYSSILKGVKIKLLPLKTFIQNISNFFRLIFLSIIKKVDLLVISMEGRGFGLMQKRTFHRRAPIKRSDYVIMFMGLFILILTIQLNR